MRTVDNSHFEENISTIVCLLKICHGDDHKEILQIIVKMKKIVYMDQLDCYVGLTCGPCSPPGPGSPWAPGYPGDPLSPWGPEAPVAPCGP